MERGGAGSAGTRRRCFKRQGRWTNENMCCFNSFLTGRREAPDSRSTNLITHIDTPESSSLSGGSTGQNKDNRIWDENLPPSLVCAVIDRQWRADGCD